MDKHAQSLPGTNGTSGLASSQQQLLQSRARVWTAIAQWVRSTPARHQLVILGDMNCTLRPQEPHVGLGVAHHKTFPHPDQNDFQMLVEALGLVALNTWGRAGRTSSTYLHLQHSVVQLDFVLVRPPCQPRAKCSKAPDCACGMCQWNVSCRASPLRSTLTGLPTTLCRRIRSERS